jgi:hypothetical protein
VCVQAGNDRRGHHSCEVLVVEDLSLIAGSPGAVTVESSLQGGYWSELMYALYTYE